MKKYVHKEEKNFVFSLFETPLINDYFLKHYQLNINKTIHLYKKSENTEFDINCFWKVGKS